MLDGKRVRQIIMILIFGSLAAGYVFGSPYYTAYIAKPITRRACNDLIQEDIRKNVPNYQSRWETRFLSKLKSAGIFVDNDQYVFNIDKTGEGKRASYTCDGALKFALDNPWFPDFDLIEAPTFRTVHKIDVSVSYSR